MGFVTSATLCSFYQLVTSERADFSTTKSGPSRVVIVVLMSMFAGPFIVVQKIIAGLRSREISAIPAAMGAVLAGMWSICAGVFYVSLLISA
jgi:hypothetical protein